MEEVRIKVEKVEKRERTKPGLDMDDPAQLQKLKQRVQQNANALLQIAHLRAEQRLKEESREFKSFGAATMGTVGGVALSALGGPTLIPGAIIGGGSILLGASELKRSRTPSAESRARNIDTLTTGGIQEMELLLERLGEFRERITSDLKVLAQEFSQESHKLAIRIMQSSRDDPDMEPPYSRSDVARAEQFLLQNQSQRAVLEQLEEIVLTTETKLAGVRLDQLLEDQKIFEQTQGIKEQVEELPTVTKESLDEMGTQLRFFAEDTQQTSQQFEDIWQGTMGRVVGAFDDSIAKMVTDWFDGIRQMVSGAALGGRGILAGLFGGLFGGSRGGFPSILTGIGLPGFPGGGVVAGSTPPFVPGAFGFLPATSGGVATELPTALGGAGEIPGALGGATQGPLGTLIFGSGAERVAALKSLGLAGANIAGSALLDIAIRAGGPVKGALGGALLGFATGASLATALGLGALGGPIGLAVGAFAGLVLGVLGRGRAKRRAAGIEEQFMREGQEIVERYKEFEIQFGPAIAQLESLKAQGIDRLLGARLGRAGRRGARNLEGNVNVLLREVERIESQREQRRMLLGGFALPEFMFGGPVSALEGSMRAVHSVNGGLLAMLHPGEFVLRKEAVQAMGESVLATLNSSPQSAVAGADLKSADGGLRQPRVTVNFNIRAVDGASVARFWRQSRPQIIKAVRKAIGDRAL